MKNKYYNKRIIKIRIKKTGKDAGNSSACLFLLKRSGIKVVKKKNEQALLELPFRREIEEEIGSVTFAMMENAKRSISNLLFVHSCKGQISGFKNEYGTEKELCRICIGKKKEKGNYPAEMIGVGMIYLLASLALVFVI